MLLVSIVSRLGSVGPLKEKSFIPLPRFDSFIFYSVLLLLGNKTQLMHDAWLFSSKYVCSKPICCGASGANRWIELIIIQEKKTKLN